MEAIELANQSIAVGDLATAAVAGIGSQLLGGGFSSRSLVRDILTTGGSALVGCQVADLVQPRVQKAFESAYESIEGIFVKGERSARMKQIEDIAIRSAVASAVGWGLLYLAHGGGRITARSLIPAAVIGGSCAAGHMVTAYVVKMKAQKAAASQKKE